MRPHSTQYALWSSEARYCVVAAGRRSGKSELAKRRGVLAAMTHHTRAANDGHYKFGAPTLDQAKKIYWDDLERFIPPALIANVSKSELWIELVNHARLHVVGLDAVRRIEGQPMDWFFGDEAQEWRRNIWDVTIMPALQDRDGRAWVYGVPRPGAEFEELEKRAKSGDHGWQYFSWRSVDILGEQRLEQARSKMDARLYSQEFEAERVALQGRAYYTFDRQFHGREPLTYDPTGELLLCFDFNVCPGVAVIAQNQRFRWKASDRLDRPDVADSILAVIGEVYIAENSRTEHVVRRIISDWGRHKGRLILYGDRTGGNRHSAQGATGTDWDIIRSMLRDHFGDRISVRMRSKNPPERDRVNALCALFRDTNGVAHVLISPKCANVLDDCDATMLVQGGSGEIDKDRDGGRHSHLTDAIGYLAEYEHSTRQIRIIEDSL